MDNKHLIASAGMMLTNGDIYVTEVWLGDWDSPDNWREVTEEEALTASELDHEIV